MFIKRIRIKRIPLNLFFAYSIYRKKAKFKKQAKKIMKYMFLFAKRKYIKFFDDLESFYYSEDLYLDHSSEHFENQNKELVKKIEKMGIQLKNMESAIENLKKIK